MFFVEYRNFFLNVKLTHRHMYKFTFTVNRLKIEVVVIVKWV